MDVLVNCLNCWFGLVLFVIGVFILCIINQLFELSVWGCIVGTIGLSYLSYWNTWFLIICIIGMFGF